MATVLVNEVVGTAWIRNADGSRTQIQQGMQIPENAEIITENGARVVLNADDAPALTIGENREFALAPEVFDTNLDAFGAAVDGTQPVDPDVARVLAALDGDGDIFEDLEATAAVLNAAGGDGAGGSSFTRLMSIIETTRPLALAYPRPGVDAPDPQILGGQARDAAALADAGAGAGAGAVGDDVGVGAPGAGGGGAGAPVGGAGGTPVVPEGEVTPEPGVPGGSGGSIPPSVVNPTLPTPQLVVATVVLESPETVVEGVEYEITARVDIPVTGTDLVVELSNGETITIPIGQTEAKVTVSTREDDAYIQGSIPESVTITGATGGGYDLLDTRSTTTTKVVDNEDATEIKLSSDDKVTEGGMITVTAEVANAPKETDLVITLESGEQITIEKDKTTGSVEVKTRPNDVYKQGEEDVAFKIKTVEGGNYEALDTSSTTTTKVVDNEDATEIKLSSEKEVKEGGKINVVASVNNAPETDMEIELKSGEKITILAGNTTGSIEVDTRTNDVYKQGSEVVGFEIDSVTGGNYEALDTSSTTTTTVVDGSDAVNVTITATAKAQTINSSSAVDGSNGVTITAFGNDGKKTGLSVIKGTNHDGFGVETKINGNSVEKSNGDTKELGLGEKIIVDFDKEMNSIDVAFAWRNNSETAELTFTKNGEKVGSAKVTGDGNSTNKAFVTYYDASGAEIKTVNAKGSSDKVDEAFTFELPDVDGNILSFDKVEFTAPTKVDDYLIHEIRYKEAIESPNITVDENGQVTFAVQMDEKYPPQGKAVATVVVNGKEIEVELNATGRGSFTVDANDLGDLSDVAVKVTKVTGGNYETVDNTGSERFNFSGVLDLSSSDDSISTTAGESYTLKADDFGDNLSASVKAIEFTSVPENGAIYHEVKVGVTIIDQEGKKTKATEDARVEIKAGSTILLSEIESGSLVFEPSEGVSSAGNFEFKVGDGVGEFSDGTYTTSITIVLQGTDEGDTLEGGDGDDTIHGGKGDDVLIGGKGDDTLYGGKGIDKFVWEPGDHGNDTIKDYGTGEIIDISGLLAGVVGSNLNLSDYVSIEGNKIYIRDVITQGKSVMESANVTIDVQGNALGGSLADIASTVLPADEGAVLVDRPLVVGEQFSDVTVSANTLLVYEGETLADSLKGSNDTIYLQSGQNLDFSKDNNAANLQGVETIDLTRVGEGHKISGLGFDQMKTLFGDPEDSGNKVLTIKANGNDIIDLNSGVDNDHYWRLSTIDKHEGSTEEAVSSSTVYVLAEKVTSTDDDNQSSYKDTGYSVKVESPGATVNITKASDDEDAFNLLEKEDDILDFNYEIKEIKSDVSEAGLTSVSLSDEDLELILIESEEAFVPLDEAKEGEAPTVVKEPKLETEDSAFVVLGETATDLVEKGSFASSDFG